MTPEKPSLRSALRTTAALLALCALGRFANDERFLLGLVRDNGIAPRHVMIARSLVNPGLNAEDRAARTAGYYQGLLDGGNAALTAGFLAQRLDLRRDQRGIAETFHARWTGDFLWYDLPPHLDAQTPAGRLVTNSEGLADLEYARARAPGTRRVALLGDSLVRGWGTDFGLTFEARLEERLNERHLSAETQRIELINFAVDGYRLTQIFERAATTASAWQPDVYVVGVSALAGPRQWTAHLAGLLREGRDFKYKPLRRVAREAGLSRYDAPAVTRAKLAPHHAAVLRFCLEELRALAERQGAELLVLLTPTVEPPADLAPEFAGVQTALDELGIRAVDLRGAFAAAEDLRALRISDSDTHPNAAGHALLFEELYAQLLASPETLCLLTGP